MQLAAKNKLDENNLLSATNVLVAFCLATSAEFSGGNMIWDTVSRMLTPSIICFGNFP